MPSTLPMPLRKTAPAMPTDGGIYSVTRACRCGAEELCEMGDFLSCNNAQIVRSRARNFMEDDMDDRIVTAADAIKAFQLSPRRWAHYDYPTGRWWALSRADMVALLAVLDEPDQAAAYSRWCANAFARPLSIRQRRALDKIRYPRA